MHSMIKLRIEELLANRPEKENTLYWLAKTANVEYGSLWRLTQGVSKSISFELMDQICTALKCQPGELMIQVKGATPPEMRKSKKEKQMIELSDIQASDEFLYQAVRAHVVYGTSTLANIVAHCKQRGISKENIVKAFKEELFSRLPKGDAQSDLDSLTKWIEENWEAGEVKSPKKGAAKK